MKNKHTKTTTALFAIFSSVLMAFIASNNSYAEHTLSLSTSGAQIIDVSTNGNGTTISEAEISVSTTCQAGYNLSFSTTVSDNNLYLNGDVSNSTTGNFFAPSDGATSLASANNTWGYYLPSDGETPTAETIFSAVPTLNHPSVLKTPAQTASDSEINDVFSIYYGVKASKTIRSGKYTMINDENDAPGTIVYYATLSEDCFRYTVEYNPTGTNTGVEITGTGTVDSQPISAGVATNLTSNTYGNPTIDGITYYFTGWNTAQDGTGTRYASGASVTDLATAGTTITLYAQWSDCPSGNICYFKNNTDVEGSMGFQEATGDTDVTLFAPNYSLPEFGFIGWSEDKTAPVKLAEHEAVTIYGPNETINSGDLSIEGKSLYAVWLEATETLQEWNSCDALEIGDVIALQDARDTNAYGVAKLADGKCWMIETLRLESKDSVGEKALLAQSYNSSFTGLANPEYENFADSAIANSLYSTNGTTENAISGEYHGSRFPRYNNTNTLLGESSPTNSSTSIFGYGNYYTWPAVIADTSLHYNSNISIDETSICPTGWRVPRGGDKSIEENNDFWHLIVEGINSGVKPDNYNSSTRPYYSGAPEGKSLSEALRRFPNNMLQSGYYFNDSALNRGSIGAYWTSTTSINNGAYSLNIEANRVDPGTSFSSKYRGYSVRCLYAGDE